MGRRRRRVIRIVKKKLPTVFVCPRCGEEAVRVTIAKDTGKATVMCALCQLKDEFPAHPAAQMIDVYSYFADRFYGVKDPRAIIPHEREAPQFAPEEVPSEPESEATVKALDEPGLPQESEAVPGNHEEMLEPSTENRDVEKTVEHPAPPMEASSQETGSGATEATQNSEATDEEKASAEEENEPFADILENKDKKRYSPNPLPQHQSEQTSQASD